MLSGLWMVLQLQVLINTFVYCWCVFMPPPTIRGGGVMFPGRPSFRPLSFINYSPWRYIYTEWRHSSETCPFIMWVVMGVAEKSLRSEVKGQGHDPYNGRGIHYDGVAARLSCCIIDSGDQRHHIHLSRQRHKSLQSQTQQAQSLRSYCHIFAG